MYPLEFNSELYQEKYRIKSTRLPNWDYSSNGFYFITICTKNCVEHFGEVDNYIMGLNEIGCIVVKFWQDVPRHFDNVRLYEWVVMPNHMHCIIQIYNPDSSVGAVVGGNSVNTNPSNVTNTNTNPPNVITPRPCRDAINRVSTVGGGNGGITGYHNPMGKNTLGEIIRWFKGRTSFEIHKNIDSHFQWQPRFYDHIIRNEKSLYEISKYIYNNPEKWELDRNNHSGLWM